MANARYLHISFKFHGLPKVKSLEGVFDKALDWYRYASNCWIIRTTRSPTVWYDRLKPHLAPDDSLFICEINLENHQGWMEKDFWDWLEKDGGDKWKDRSKLQEPASD